MRRSLFSVAVAGVFLALAAAGPGFSQINTGGIPPIQRATFNLAQAYPATSGTYTGASPVVIAPNGCWNPNGQDISVTDGPGADAGDAVQLCPEPDAE